jgi:lipoprotein-anchoring transpeptidase ErfK/SrfK
VAHLVPPPQALAVADAAPTFTTPATTQPATAVQRGSVVAALNEQAKAPVAPQPTPPVATVPAQEPVAVQPAQLVGPSLGVTPAQSKSELRIADATPSVPLVTNDTADLANAVGLRVHDSVPSNLFKYFDVYLYVSKAAAGPWAQHMFIFHKGADNHLVFEQTIPVSTGRERHEKYFTSTPTGLFELDPNRFDRNHHSRRWNNAPMPWAMFLDYTINNHLAGVALHSGIGHVPLLGQRASGGCVRLPPEMAEMLFKRFQATEAGMVPRFAFNDSHSTTRTDGTLELGADGQPVLSPGYKVLLIIQDYPGGPALVAEVS